jgi:thiamine monophosphate synthase
MTGGSGGKFRAYPAGDRGAAGLRWVAALLAASWRNPVPDYQQQIRSLIKRYEAEARKQIKALQSRAKKQLPRRRQQLLKAVRQLRKMVNQQLGVLERRLVAAGRR